MRNVISAFFKCVLLLLLCTNAEKGIAQISCDFNFTQPIIGCSPLLISATANEVSGSPVVERVWQLTGPASFVTYTTTPGFNNPQFNYFGTISGNYCLRLTSRNANGQTCTIQKCGIYVAANPVIDMTFNNSIGCLPLTVSVDCNSTPGSGTLDSMVIDWQCGPVDLDVPCTSTPLTHTYTCPPGFYDPTVIVFNSYGCHSDSTYNDAIHIVPKPHTFFTADITTSNCASGPLTVNFTADSAMQPCVTYDWYINNVLAQHDSIRTFQHSFAINSLDCYDIKLIVTNCSGCSDSSTRTDYICVRSTPNISFSVNDSVGCITPGNPFNLIFTNTSGAPPQLTWTLTGPGGFNQTQGPAGSVSYNLTTLGIYNVSATGSFGPGCSTTITQQQVVTIKQAPSFSFTTADVFSCSTPYTVHYNATGCSTCTYSWQMPSGTPSNASGSNATTIYNTFNNFSATVVATDVNGCSTSVTNQLVSTKKLKAKIGFNKSKGCEPLCPDFTDLTNASLVNSTILNRTWTFTGPTLIPTATTGTVNQCFNAPGCYDVQLAVTTASGCSDTLLLLDTICAGVKPHLCSLTAAPLSMCFEADTVKFNVLGCDSFDWIQADFGDGPIAIFSSGNFDHLYRDTGVFFAKIVAFNDSCPSDTLIQQITIWPPITKFVDSTFCNRGDTVFLYNKSLGADTYLWTFCDGTTSNLPNPNVVLPSCTTCVCTLQTHTILHNCFHQKIDTISTACSTASFSPPDTVGCAPFHVQFQNTSSSSIANLTRWDFDACPVINFGGSNLSNHTFTTPGSYCIAMRNTSLAGCKDTVFSTVTVCDVHADFGPSTVCLPLPYCPVDFSVDSFCGIASRIWDFGDGSVDTGCCPCHVYATSGNYYVKLVVTNNLGCSDSITKAVFASNPIQITYKVDTLLCEGAGTCMTNTSQANLQFHWDLPGAIPPVSNVYAPCFSFPSGSGDYPLHLTISAGGLCTVDDYRTIHVHNPVVGGWVSDDTIDCPNPPHIITLTDTSKYNDGPVTVCWGDGPCATIAPGSTVNHIFGAPGRYDVTMVDSTLDGCKDSALIAVIVVNGPYGELTVDPLAMCSCKDTVYYNVSTYNATTFTLLYGCNAGSYSIASIVPIGTPQNPTNYSTFWKFCRTDTCQPQMVFGDASGCQVFLDKPFIVVDSPVVDFTFNNYGVCVNGTVCFFDATKYHLRPDQSYTTRFLWDFGDNSADRYDSTNLNPCHYYGNVGGYNAKLYVWSNLGCFDSAVGHVVIIPEFPIAGYYADDSLVCAHSPICFHDTSWIYPLTHADYWVWDWGDGRIDTTHTGDTCHAYTNGGYYRVTMCVYDSVGCPDCDSSTVIRVIDNPIANAGGDQAVCYGAVTVLNGSGGVVCHWAPSGLVSNPNICNPSITLFGDTDIILMVSDQYGCADTDTVHLSTSYVIANFNVGTRFCTDDSICVTDSSVSVNGVLTNWMFDYGDGDTLMGSYVCHYYGTPGSYDIIETAINEHGCLDTALHTVLLLPSPQAAFSITDTVICADQQICITDLTSSISPIQNADWSFGANQQPCLGCPVPPCHTFTPPFFPTFNVSLAVTDQNSCHDTAVIVVTVNELPVANFNWSTSCENENMPLSNNSVAGDGAISHCEWTLWLGAVPPTIDSSCNTSFHFAPGSHDVQLVVTDLNGCRDTVVQTVLTDSLSRLVIYPGDTTICLGYPVDYTVSGVFDYIRWTPNIWISDPNATTVTISPLGDIQYIVSAVNGVCNSANDTFTIQTIEHIPLEVDATPDHIVLGLSSNLTSQYPGRVDSIIWSPDATLDCRSCPNPIAIPSGTTTYTATIYYSKNGVTCTSMASATIDVLGKCDERSIYVPNTFTPNGDGLNDVFMIRGLPVAKINYFRIFDRWGKLVFEAQNGEANEPKWGWNGADMHGEKLNPAVFVYTYEIECVNHDIFSGHGNVTLVR